MRYLAVLFVFIISNGAFAEDTLKSMNLAQQLGSILGGEKNCGYALNADAIQAFIEKRVSADDLGFANMLVMMQKGSEVEFEQNSEMGKVAYCTQVSRSAKALGLVK